MIFPNPERNWNGPRIWAAGFVLLLTYGVILGFDYFTRIWRHADPLLWVLFLFLPAVFVAGVFYLMVIPAGDRQTLAVLVPGIPEYGLCPETRISVSVTILWTLLMVNLVLVTVLYLILVIAAGWNFAWVQYLLLGVCFFPAIYFDHRIYLLWNPPVRQLMGFRD